MVVDMLLTALLLVGLTACNAISTESITYNEIPSGNKFDFWNKIDNGRRMLLEVEAAFKKLKGRRELTDFNKMDPNESSHLEEATAETARKFSVEPRVNENSVLGAMRVDSVSAAARELTDSSGPFEQKDRPGSFERSVAEAARQFDPDASQSKDPLMEDRSVFLYVNGASGRFWDSPNDEEQASAEAAKKFLERPSPSEEAIAEAARKFGPDSSQNEIYRNDDGRVFEPVNETAEKFHKYLAEAMVGTAGKLSSEPVMGSVPYGREVLESDNAAARRPQDGSSQLEGLVHEAARKFHPDANLRAVLTRGNKKVAQFAKSSTRNFKNQYKQNGAQAARMFGPDPNLSEGFTRGNMRVPQFVNSPTRNFQDQYEQNGAEAARMFGPDPNLSGGFTRGNMRVAQFVNSPTRNFQNQYEQNGAEAGRMLGPDPNLSEGFTRGNMRVAQFVNSPTRNFQNQYQQNGAEAARMFAPGPSDEDNNSAKLRVFGTVSESQYLNPEMEEHNTATRDFGVIPSSTQDHSLGSFTYKDSTEATREFTPQITARQRRSPSDIENHLDTLNRPGTQYQLPSKPLTHDQLLASVRDAIFQNSRKIRSVVPEVLPWIPHPYALHSTSQENPSAVNAPHQASEPAETGMLGPSKQKRSPQPEPSWPDELPRPPKIPSDFPDTNPPDSGVLKDARDSTDEFFDWFTGKFV